jgi:hypothetical protein
VRRDGIFELDQVELTLVDVWVEDLGHNVECVDDEHRQEGSQREKEWRRLSLKRSIGSRSRRADTWLSERRELDLYITDLGRSGGIRMAVMKARSALPDSSGSPAHLRI